MQENDKFNILYQSLVDGNKEYVEFIGKVIGVLLIAIGWLAANEDPFPLLGNKTMMWTSVVLIFFGIIVISWVSIFHYLRANKRYKLIKSLEYTEETLFAHYRITISMIGPVLFIHTALFIAILVLIYSKYGIVA